MCLASSERRQQWSRQQTSSSSSSAVRPSSRTTTTTTTTTTTSRAACVRHTIYRTLCARATPARVLCRPGRLRLRALLSLVGEILSPLARKPKDERRKPEPKIYLNGSHATQCARSLARWIHWACSLRLQRPLVAASRERATGKTSRPAGRAHWKRLRQVVRRMRSPQLLLQRPTMYKSLRSAATRTRTRTTRRLDDDDDDVCDGDEQVGRR